MILYSTHCPKCNILEKKMIAKNIGFDIVTDIKTLREKNILEVPVLEKDGKLLSFKEAVDLVNNYKE